jgi:hypothetical protein
VPLTDRPQTIDSGRRLFLRGRLFSAHRFFKAATIAALPAALSTRFFLMGLFAVDAFPSI